MQENHSIATCDRKCKFLCLDLSQRLINDGKYYVKGILRARIYLKAKISVRLYCYINNMFKVMGLENLGKWFVIKFTARVLSMNRIREAHSPYP